jgi:hypothetical protein
LQDLRPKSKDKLKPKDEGFSAPARPVNFSG